MSPAVEYSSSSSNAVVVEARSSIVVPGFSTKCYTQDQTMFDYIYQCPLVMMWHSLWTDDDVALWTDDVTLGPQERSDDVSQAQNILLFPSHKRGPVTTAV